MSAVEIIPQITDPLGASWDQPERKDILVDQTHAVMTLTTFLSLSEYSCSNPSGIYPGKMWKRHDGAFDREFIARGGKPKWLLCWFGESKKGPEFCSNNYREILLADCDIDKVAA
jgi:hypothetical protein